MGMKRALAVLAVAISFFSVDLAAAPSAEAAAREGRREAQSDIRDGRLILRTYGFAPGGTTSSQKVFERYGVRRQPVAGCIVSPAILAETAAYNEVMKAEIRKRFGAAALDAIEGRDHKKN
jgi:hypothetical protein